MTRYRSTSARMWADKRFRDLSNDAKLVWTWLLLGLEVTNLPGLVVAGRAQIAEVFGWTPEAFQKRFRELETNVSEESPEPMAQADWEARVVWLPNAILHRPPANPNVVKGWFDNLDRVPECALKNEALRRYHEHLLPRGKPFTEPFEKRYGKQLGLGMPNQDQDQVQDQLQNQDQIHTHSTRMREDDLHSNPNGSESIRSIVAALESHDVWRGLLDTQQLARDIEDQRLRTLAVAGTSQDAGGACTLEQVAGCLAEAARDAAGAAAGGAPWDGPRAATAVLRYCFVGSRLPEQRKRSTQRGRRADPAAPGYYAGCGDGRPERPGPDPPERRQPDLAAPKTPFDPNPPVNQSA